MLRTRGSTDSKCYTTESERAKHCGRFVPFAERALGLGTPEIVLGSNDPNMLLTPLSKVFQQVSPGSQGHDAINHGARADVNRRYQA